MTHIKISGITRPQDAELAVEAGADWVACVFNVDSPRYVTISQAISIRRCVSAGTKLVGIFVDTPAPLVQRVVDSCYLDCAQFFGRESRAEVEAVHPAAFKGIVAADTATLDHAVHTFLGRWVKFSPDHPALMVHLTGPIGSTWELVAGRSTRAPILLAASGLTAATAADAIAAAHPWGVDVWDAVESAPGQLDPVRLREFVAAVHDADHSFGAERSTHESRRRHKFQLGRTRDAEPPKDPDPQDESGADPRLDPRAGAEPSE